MNVKKTKRSNQSGFTLVEMAIVLVIIGLILGAVSIGKDLQRDAEYTKVKQKFVDQWVSAYNAHYQRAGVVLADDETRPQIMVNGFDHIQGGTASGGDMSGVTLPNAICEGAQGPNMSRNTNNNLHTYFDNLGIRMPPGRAEGSEDRYVYLDSNGNPQEIQICFQWNNPTEAAGSGNVMVITGLTPDLARSLDQMIDGKPDAQEGVFRRQGVANGTPGGPGTPWAETNQDSFGGAGTNLDEDQIITVVANYKMNQ
ncbi:MAG: prepilin-type N-terminal cleavage/methylation domain-containing protein [Alcanivoracaceae bacterium]|nr:prepilin-type N-terminal cleavage/methylation domain-containing protein [Alcanivoracaceae bacterium]